jgi:hypothetical protein
VTAPPQYWMHWADLAEPDELPDRDKRLEWLGEGLLAPPFQTTLRDPHLKAYRDALDGRASHASSNRHVRRTLLQEREINTQPLTNIDWIDAALCALAAHHFLSASVNTHGDVEEGFIVVPG